MPQAPTLLFLGMTKVKPWRTSAHKNIFHFSLLVFNPGNIIFPNFRILSPVPALIYASLKTVFPSLDKTLYDRLYWANLLIHCDEKIARKWWPDRDVEETKKPCALLQLNFKLENKTQLRDIRNNPIHRLFLRFAWHWLRNAIRHSHNLVDDELAHVPFLYREM